MLESKLQEILIQFANDNKSLSYKQVIEQWASASVSAMCDSIRAWDADEYSSIRNAFENAVKEL